MFQQTLKRLALLSASASTRITKGKLFVIGFGYFTYSFSLNLDLEKKLVQEGVKLAKTDGVEYLSMICLTDEQRQIAAHVINMT